MKSLNLAADAHITQDNLNLKLDSYRAGYTVFCLSMNQFKRSTKQADGPSSIFKPQHQWKDLKSYA